MIKDDSEIATTRRAVKVAQEAFLEVIPEVQADWTELETGICPWRQACDLAVQRDAAFAPIVGAGPGAATATLSAVRPKDWGCQLFTH